MKKALLLLVIAVFAVANMQAQESKSFDIKGTFGFDFKTPKNKIFQLLKDSNAKVEDDFSNTGNIFYIVTDYSTLSEFENIEVNEIRLSFKKSPNLSLLSVIGVDMFDKYRDILKSWIKRAKKVIGGEEELEFLLFFDNCKVFIKEDYIHISVK